MHSIPFNLLRSVAKIADAVEMKGFMDAIHHFQGCTTW